MRRLLLPFLWLGKVLHWLRLTVLNLLTLVILILIIVAIVQHFSRPQIHVAKNSVLWVEPQGSLVYSESDSWQDRLLQKIHPTQEHVLLRHLIASIDHAAKDPKIRVLALDLREFRGGSLTQLLDVAHALQRFRAQGKLIYAYAPEYSTGNYVLAAQANQVFLPELGMALITPFSSDSLYFKGLFNKIGVDVYAFRQGKYKSAVEPLTRTDMSPAAQEENRAWLATWWQSYTSAVDQGRGLSADTLQNYALHLPELLQKAQGNAAQLALQHKLITQIGDQEDFRDAITKALGQKKLRRIGWQRYYTSFAAHQPEEHGPEIAVVPIDGMLVPGDMEEPGVVAAEATVRQLDHLRHERDVKAVILQVNSPGGDVNAANAIRRAIERLRKAGKPVVVSMGTLGASGAYWLSTAADRIYAEPTTIAADIGVFVLVPNYTGLLQKIGVGYSGVSSLPHSPSLTPFAPLGKPEQQALQAVVDHLYTHFVGLVAKARHLPFAEAEKDAQGRAWSGVDAKRLGLVDGLGGMTEAEQAVAQLAHLQNGQYHLVYLPRPAGESSFAQIRSWALASLGFSLPQGSGGEALAQAQLLLQYSRPYGIFAYLPVDPKLS
ncbi:signal peptide peptidase SppA [Acidithiobacillus sp. CV18-2]|uniref:Signal peptide peptidase SppA n=1 Tax=Igneacidithiobacillus copahuensis TaxID=2724909 RepID=A0AAE2YPT4_9PROT|nr:signal peptide peptidase SppA [Igneacidithiobacillus copahuensis]MBU2755593.1 signal peptide peptidase SppA [Acidithiobacillus sp. CV18-3]MBU2756670.1 signal peptide peptidase SppA [Acidithiobacillus sp. BN09-2]MBU2777588.1 signal peptide peptidase SppA [Acidithiobacillus sp. CV18-2]MBU2795228.1 signal peptide peptidase SppA [Acidithiobacillus sp. VAN18-2]MBU2799267.1 signal peptide peptidase SppA [Acidithiobacillus sp. VAN18-4]UTV81344.1 signal peptide peptidase SppA [Acidithiobacillus sp